MDYLKKYQPFLNELRSVENKELVEGLKKFKVFWVNGILMYQEFDAMRVFQIGQHIGFEVDTQKKSISNMYTYDDRSEFRFIRKVQQALSDLYRDKVIDNTWEFTFNGDKQATQIVFGSTKLSDVLKYNSDFSKFIPIAFHGTSDHYLKEIKSKGVLPGLYFDDNQNWDKGYIDNYSEKNVYFTIDFQQAKTYAEHTTVSLENKEIKSNPIVVEIKMLPTQGIVTDDDFFTGHQLLIHSIMTGKKPKADYISGIRTSGQFAWKGIIPKRYITKIHKV